MAKIDGVQEVSLEVLKPYENNAKIHNAEQVERIAKSIKEFGFISPCLIDKDFNIIAGHGRVKAAQQLGLSTVPCVFIEGLTETQRKAYIIADNRLTELGEWDDDLLQSELELLRADGFDVDLTGFENEWGGLDTNAEEITADVNPTAALPDSKIYILSVSAFGTNSEKIVMIKLTQEIADHFLKAVEEKTTDEIVEKLVGAVNDL